MRIPASLVLGKFIFGNFFQGDISKDVVMLCFKRKRAPRLPKIDETEAGHSGFEAK